MRAENLVSTPRSLANGESETTARLRRRLERERKARREAEQVAEAATRELYDRHAEVVLLETIAVASNEGSVDTAMQVALDAICAHTGWPVGHVCTRSLDPGPELVPTSIWHLDDPVRYAAFRRITEETVFVRGVGLPGRILASGRPAWVVDVTRDDNFPRAKPALDIGVRAAFGTPVLVGSEVAAVLEFFLPEAAEPDDRLLRLMANVGAQLGRVIERTRAADEHERLRLRLETLLVSAGEGICGLDADGRTTFVNPAAARMLGRSADELIGHRIHDLVHGGPSDGHDAPTCPIYASGAGSSSQCGGDDVFQRHDGGSFPVEYITVPLFEQDALAGAVMTFNDTTERRRLEDRLRHLAEHDALTGLLNRRRFQEELERAAAAAERYGTGGAVLLLDIDNFKFVNDGLGHHAGDELIRHIAGLLRDRLRDSDILARLGGDEFAVLLPHADADQARHVAQDLLEVVRNATTAASSHPVQVSTSIGIAVMEDEGTDADELLMQADVAMYAAKNEGRNRCSEYTPEKARAAWTAGGSWSKRIRRALAEDDFVLFYQPILELADDRVSQVELLLRMRDGGELVPPGAFLPTAERFGLVHEIDRWVVRAAVRMLAAQRTGGRRLDLLVEINLSGRSVGDPALPELIEHELAATGVDPAKLIFEVTETAAIANMQEAKAFAERLAALGCRFALDDFGAGFGSFYYLKHLPLDYLKIDGEFITSLAESPADQRVVRAMVEVARGLELKTIAEFVEDAKTLRMLRTIGVDYAQGFHIGRPRPVDELLT